MAETNFKPYVPPTTDMKEFTVRALVIGLVMCVVLGAANAYLGLKAGMTIAATYPAAVIGMALLRLGKGSILEENFARTVGSIGESVAAGAVFTIPAFVVLGHLEVQSRDPCGPEYLTSAALMILGGLLGIMFVTVLRRVMVEDQLAAVPRVRGRGRDPQGRPAWCRCGTAALPGDGRWRTHQAARRLRCLPRLERFPRDDRQGQGRIRPPRSDRKCGEGGRRRYDDHLRTCGNAGVHRRRATSSGPNSARSTSRAGCWHGDSSFRCSCISSDR